MKKTITTIVLALYSLLSFGQKGASGFIQNDDLKIGITSIQTNPAPLSPGLTYVLAKEKNNTEKGDVFYSLKITMEHPFTKTLNNELKTDIEFGNGEFESEREIKENSGWFDGTFTLPIKNIQRAKEFGMIHFIIKGEKTQIYCIDDITNKEYMSKIKELIKSKL
jgi:hypothetical protein